jgi:hypothetical protein
MNTHVLEYNGGSTIVAMGPRAPRSEFARYLGNRDGRERWGLMLWALPAGFDYECEVKDLPLNQYLEAMGSSEALSVHIRKPGGRQWGADYVRYAIGHRTADPDPALSVRIPRGPHNPVLLVAVHEVFEAEEAADIVDVSTHDPKPH